MTGSSFIRSSVPLPPRVYEGDEYFCRFKPRIHRETRLADAGSWQCQVDFLESSTEARADADRNKDVSSYAVGCINPIVGNFTALCACEALPERLALTTYMVEYAYIHDDVIEYSANKDKSKLVEANTQLMEGLTMETKGGTGSKDQVKRRQLQAKMVMELMEIDKEQAQECLRLWKEMSNVFVEIRDMKFTVMNDYLKFRVVDAGCPWTMSLLCFSMDFTLTDDETQQMRAITSAAYDAWVLVNDYFSWEKEWKNHEANDSEGVIANAVWLYMKWKSVGASEAKKMLKKEIIAREEQYVQLKNDFVASGAATEKTEQWLVLLDLVTAGNFAWSMTTARYRLGGEDVYPLLRREVPKSSRSGVTDSLGSPISKNAERLADKIDRVIGDRKYLDLNYRDEHPSQQDTTSDRKPKHRDNTTSRKSKPGKKWQLYQYEDTVLEPYEYITSLPSKGVRNAMIDGLETWYNVPEESLAAIRDIIGLLHNASLMLDDIQDNSCLRRGMPATHVIFGVNQTMNAANLLLFRALKAAEKLSAVASNIMIERIIEAHIGQGLDLYWTHHTDIPSEEEYFTMVDGKTGGLFILLAELMRSEATRHKDLDASLLMKLTGRFFQARDDYKNLDCDEYAQQKGFADDIGEGKISLPLIYAVKSDSSHRGRLMSILQQRKICNDVSHEVRKVAVDAIKASGGLDFAKKTAIGLQKAIGETLSAYEDKVGEKNWLLRLALKRLEMEA
ncbi:isoprenoid synthase domain-containing protein [Nemania sp. FL0916]|nr:isoprenoid synthase domain-containing protein [Nemania sp. FL0916]